MLLREPRRQADRMNLRAHEGPAMSIRLRVAIFGTACLGLTCLYVPTSKAQVARTELHAIPTLTLPDQDEKPIRLFHGAADDYVPVVPCRAYVERLRRAGKDVTLTEFPDAHHAFDNPVLKEGPQSAPDSRTTRRCTLKEEPAGMIINAVTKQPFTMEDPCVERGPHVGYDAAATAAATQAVKEFLRVTLKLN